MKLKRLFPWLMIISLSACSWDRNDPSTPWYYPQPGSQITLNQPLSFKADTASLYFQYGKITGSGHSRFDPYCKIRVRNVKSTTQVIEPDTFLITNSGRHTELVAGLSGLKIPLGTSEPVLARISIGRSDAPSEITETIQMQLSSKRQPQVTTLVCGGVEDDPSIAEPPTFREIKEALGDIMTIRLDQFISKPPLKSSK